MIATYKDIQKETGLSLSTISKYFNGGSLREKNVKAIEAAIKKYSYRRNDFARALKTHKSFSIGILIPELTITFDTTIISGIEQILRKKGYSTIICDCRRDKDIEVESLRFLLDKMVDGIITVPCNKSGEHLQMARDRNVPVVMIDHLTSGFKTDAVIVDNRKAGEIAVTEFQEYNHKKIAIICGPKNTYTMDERMNGFINTLNSRGITAESSYIKRGSMTVDGGVKMMKELLLLNDPPTAVFCVNYELTLGAVIALNETGKKIGEDISLIGFDNIMMLSQLVVPTLSIITQPMDKLSVFAAKLMMEKLENPDDSTYKTIECNINYVKGGSVKRLERLD